MIAVNSRSSWQEARKLLTEGRCTQGKMSSFFEEETKKRSMEVKYEARGKSLNGPSAIVSGRQTGRQRAIIHLFRRLHKNQPFEER